MAITTINLTDPVASLVTKTNQISTNMGDKDVLTTDDTSSLVSAINEIQAKIIQIDETQEIASDVATYFTTNTFTIGDMVANNGEITDLSSTRWNGDLTFADSDDVRLPSRSKIIWNEQIGDDDLEIYHDGVTGDIINGSGDLRIKYDENFIIRDSNFVERMKFTQDDIQMNGDITLQNATDLNLGDNGKVNFGDNDDLKIYHNGTHSYIDETGSGTLFIRTDRLQVQTFSGENVFAGLENGAVNLYHDNVSRLATTNTGVDVTGTLTGSVDVSGGTLTLANDQISGDKIQGGTIGSVSIGTATVTTLIMESVNLDNIKPLQIKNSAGTTLLAGYLLSTSNTSGTL